MKTDPQPGQNKAHLFNNLFIVCACLCGPTDAVPFTHGRIVCMLLLLQIDLEHSKVLRGQNSLGSL